MNDKPDKIDKRDVILDSANKMFTRKGFNGTSVGEIAKEAGLSKASLYYYYESKDEILYELVKRTLLNVMNYIDQSFSDKTELIKDKEWIKDFTNRVYNIIESEKDVFKIALTEDLKTNLNDSMIFELLSSMFKEYEKIFEIPDEDKTVIFILAITFVVFSSLKDKMSNKFNIDVNDLDSYFKKNFGYMFEQKVQNLKVRE